MLLAAFNAVGHDCIFSRKDLRARRSLMVSIMFISENKPLKKGGVSIEAKSKCENMSLLGQFNWCGSLCAPRALVASNTSAEMSSAQNHVYSSWWHTRGYLDSLGFFPAWKNSGQFLREKKHKKKRWHLYHGWSTYPPPNVPTPQIRPYQGLDTVFIGFP